MALSIQMLMQPANKAVDLILSSSLHSAMVLAFAVLAVLYLAYRRKVEIYLIDYSCYCPPSSYRLTKSMFKESMVHDNMDPDSVAFQCKILEKSGYSEQTCIPPPLACIPKTKALSSALEEVETIMFAAIAHLYQQSNINPKAIDILITNSSVFSPTPSLSAMVVNKFRMRSDIMSFNLSGMGCSAGLISVSLARDLLRVHRNSLALIASTECLNLNWYTGKVPSMLLTNCLFRMGGAAILMSSRVQDKHRAKYKLKHIVRTSKARNDQSHGCIYMDVDPDNEVGVSISKNVVNFAGDALKTNIASLAPLVFSYRERFIYAFSLICHKLGSRRETSIYAPNFSKAFEHFCIHAGGRAVIEAIKRKLRLRKQDVEASTMTLHRFGNTSSSSIWYELCYIEAKGRMKCGDRVWQIAFGSGFKCNSAVWQCLRDVNPDTANAWRYTIRSYPVQDLIF
ncbi:probable 3-ketoacyl-CoA synthase 21 [Prosopis cineraria]|uniref:probable 3-ketoacyl-CoA synthase 21 n=1 Tax=Prosopis cineraria TaxID=364024 RepID=UPI00240FC8F6|nr:probable 3-ketoacyl-CoA synthase 21 [Prosopis cineraria]